MKTRTLGLVALLAVGALILAGCNKTENNPEVENSEIANPASVYCEENNGTLNLEEGVCTFEDGSSCEEWSYYRNECQPGDSISASEEENVNEEEISEGENNEEVTDEEEAPVIEETIDEIPVVEETTDEALAANVNNETEE